MAQCYTAQGITLSAAAIDGRSVKHPRRNSFTTIHATLHFFFAFLHGLAAVPLKIVPGRKTLAIVFGAGFAMYTGERIRRSIVDAAKLGLDIGQWYARLCASWGSDVTHYFNYPDFPSAIDGPHQWLATESSGWRYKFRGVSTMHAYQTLPPIRSSLLPVSRTPRFVEGARTHPIVRSVEYGPWSWGAGETLGYTRLTGLLYRNDGENLLYAFYNVSDYGSIPSASYAGALSRYRTAKHKSMGIVATVLSGECSRDDQSAAQEMIRAEVPVGSVPDETVIHYRPLYADVECGEDKPMPLAAACRPVLPVNGAGYGAAMMGPSTEIHTTKVRIMDPASNLCGNSDDLTYRAEFVAYHASRILPVTTDCVIEQMDKPSQKANRELADSFMDIYGTSTKRSFTKAEPTQVGKPARNICTVEPQRLFQGTLYSLSLAKHFMSLPYWVWGCGSGATARRYHQACAGHEQMMESDYSKFDASLPPFFHDLHWMLIVECFRDWEDFDEAQRDTIGPEMLSACGQLYYLGHGRVSGQNETTLWNTLDQAYLQYASYRDHGLAPADAWKTLNEGLLGGDDGLVPYVGQNLELVSTRFGMKVVTRVFDSDEPCRFLGRIYPSGRNSPDSYYDLQSFLERFHIINVNNMTPEQGLVCKAYGLSITDPECPIIKNYIRSVFAAYPKLKKYVATENEWWLSHYDQRDPYPYSQTAEEDVYRYTAAQVGCEVEALLELNHWLFENPLYVGSDVPVLQSDDVPVGLVGAFEVWGVVFGIPGPAPQLPRKTFKKKEDLAVGAPNATMPRTRRASIASSLKSGTSVKCKKCGAHGHHGGQCADASFITNAVYSAAEEYRAEEAGTARGRMLAEKDKAEAERKAAAAAARAQRSSELSAKRTRGGHNPPLDLEKLAEQIGVGVLKAKRSLERVEERREAEVVDNGAGTGLLLPNNN